jgi:hypothetical protein
VTRTPCDAAGWGEQDTIYGDLHRIAVRHARRLVAHPTLQPTMPVHEAWLRLSGRRCGRRTHYLALGSRAMHHFIIDYLAREAVAEARRDAGAPAGDRTDGIPIAGRLIQSRTEWHLRHPAIVGPSGVRDGGLGEQQHRDAEGFEKHTLHVERTINRRVARYQLHP